MNPAYQVGETVLMNLRGWLRAFRVVDVREVDGNIEYQLETLGKDHQWQKPAS